MVLTPRSAQVNTVLLNHRESIPHSSVAVTAALVKIFTVPFAPKVAFWLVTVMTGCVTSTTRTCAVPELVLPAKSTFVTVRVNVWLTSAHVKV